MGELLFLLFFNFNLSRQCGFVIYDSCNSKKKTTGNEGTEKLPEIRKIKILKKERKHYGFAPFSCYKDLVVS
jgi:hypothetical protein